jgi:predicted nuclease with TOPRIM domain
MFTHTHDRAKMADEASRNIDALNKIVNATDQSGNMRKDLKKTTFETVSTLRNLFHKMKEMLDEKSRQNKHLENEATKMNKELDNCRNTTPKGQAETPNVRMQELPRTDSRQVLPPNESNRKLYSSILAGHVETKHKIFIKSRLDQSPNMIKKLLK